MFSFIKWFSSFFENLKKNKGLWFTFLTVISVAGIFTSLYFVNFLVGDVAQKTYENQKNHYVLSLKNKISSQNSYIDAVATIVSKDKSIADEFFAEDENASQRIKQKSALIVAKLNKSIGKKSINISFVESKKSKSFNGVNVSENGTVFESIIPMINKDGNIINVLAQKNMDILADVYKKEHKEFAFFLNESSINKIDKNFKKSNYLNFDDRLYVLKDKYDNNFLASIKSLKFDKKLKENGYIKSPRYFYTYQKVYDFTGDVAGIAFVAEEIKDDNSFVNLVKNLVNTVTMVALGLIVSMILFLF
jgi:hypothetical protein